jgi:hypothetical protein
VTAIPKSRDFSDGFMWALLARSSGALLARSPPMARLRAVRPSRASRGSPVWRVPGTYPGAPWLGHGTFVLRVRDDPVLRSRFGAPAHRFRRAAISDAFARVRSASGPRTGSIWAGRHRRESPEAAPRRIRRAPGVVQAIPLAGRVGSSGKGGRRSHPRPRDRAMKTLIAEGSRCGLPRAPRSARGLRDHGAGRKPVRVAR